MYLTLSREYGVPSTWKGRYMVQLLRRHPLMTFFVLAFCNTWVVWIPRPVPSQASWGRCGPWRAPGALARRLAVVSGGPPRARCVFARGSRGLCPTWRLLGNRGTDGLGEELAWRGFALPRLLLRHKALAASLILGVFWGLWHRPLVCTEGATMNQQPI